MFLNKKVTTLAAVLVFTALVSAHLVKYSVAATKNMDVLLLRNHFSTSRKESVAVTRVKGNFMRKSFITYLW